MIPKVTLTILDGALGILPPGQGDIMALVGASTGGTLAINTPAAYARGKDVQTALGTGPLVEAAAYEIERTGKPVVIVRTAASTEGDYGDLDDDDFAGLSAASFAGGTHPDDDYEAVLKFPTGGTIGVDGIKYQWSLDGGRTFSPLTKLGTADHIVIPESGGARVNFGAGTITTGDVLSFRTTAPQWSNDELSDALGALGASNIGWGFAQIVGALDDTSLETADAWLAALALGGKLRWGIGHARIPNIGETEAQYRDALTAIFGEESSLWVDVCAGSAKTLSSISRRKYRRPPSFSVATRAAGVEEHVDLAEVDLGPLPGVDVRDANGNPDDHDETINPGLDDDRFTTLMTRDGYQGVFVTNPRILAPTGSDFIFLQFRRVMNLACTVVIQEMTRRLSKPVRVDKNTGFILDEEARAIESVVNAKLRTALLTRPKASDVNFVLSRTDNILSTFTLNCSGRVIPLGYPKSIPIEMAFNNPALRIAA